MINNSLVLKNSILNLVEYESLLKAMLARHSLTGILTFSFYFTYDIFGAYYVDVNMSREHCEKNLTWKYKMQVANNILSLFGIKMT